MTLFNADGETVDAYAYSDGNPEGRSDERMPPEADRWLDAVWEGGTPGRMNSVSPKAFELETAGGTHRASVRRAGRPHVRR